jgi:hypothetical protein
MREHIGTVRTDRQEQSGGTVAATPRARRWTPSRVTSASSCRYWRSDALAKPAREQVWTAAARFDAVLTTAVMDETGKSAWCRAHGTYAQRLAAWRTSAIQALAEGIATQALAEGIASMLVKPVLHVDNGSTLKATTVLSLPHCLDIKPSCSRRYVGLGPRRRPDRPCVTPACAASRQATGPAHLRDAKLTPI